MIYLQKLLRYNNYHAVTRKVIFLLQELTKLKDLLIDNLIDEFDIFSLVCKSCLNFKFKDNFHTDYYTISKMNYDTPMIFNAILFLTNFLQSEIFYNNSRSLRNVSISNISPIIELFNSLFELWNSFTPDINDPRALTSEISEEILIFEKYKHIPGMNFPKAILELIKMCQNTFLSLNKINNLSYTYPHLSQTNRSPSHTQFLIPSETSFEREKTNYDCLITFLDACCRDLENKCNIIDEFNFAQGEDNMTSEDCYRTLYVYTQSTTESEKQLWTMFKFSAEDVIFQEIVNRIQEHYNLNLNFYIFDENNKISVRIKDDNDFYELLDEAVLKAKAIKNPIATMKLLVDDADKNEKIKYICNCVYCGRKYEYDVKEIDKENANLCETCKNYLLAQIVGNISQNMSMNTMSNIIGSPYKNMLGFQSPYNNFK